MRNRDDLTALFTTYFGDKLSPPQIDRLVSDVMAAGQPLPARTDAVSQAAASYSQPPRVWSAALI